MKVGILGGGHFWRAWDAPYSTIEVATPYGPPADAICSGAVDRHQVFTLQRHGARHELDPGAVPWRANAFAIASCGVDFVIHVTACGALGAGYGVGDVVLVTQLIDFTRSRPTTIGPPALSGVTHLACAEPFDRELTAQAALALETVRAGATMVTIEGPRFSTIAESRMFRTWGADLVNMTSAPEVFLLAELGLRVVGLALVTDRNTSGPRAEQVDGDIVATAVNEHRDRIPEAVLGILRAVHLEDHDGHRPRAAALPVDRLDLRPLGVTRPPAT